MKIERTDSFEIEIVNNVTLIITGIRLGDETIFFEVASGEVLHGKVYKVEGKYPLSASWQTSDDIEPLFVKKIGEAIESHFA